MSGESHAERLIYDHQSTRDVDASALRRLTPVQALADPPRTGSCFSPVTFPVRKGGRGEIARAAERPR